MATVTPGEDSALGERIIFAIDAEHHRGPTAVENALMLKHPDLFRSRGFLSSYIKGRRGARFPDPKAMKAIADFLHVSFEWLVIGSGPMRRDGRGQTPAEMAMFTARDFGIRGDAWDVAWDRNRDREAAMTAEDWFEEIRREAERLDRGGIPRPEAVIAVKDAQKSIQRAAKKKRRSTRESAPPPARVTARAVGEK